MGEGLRRDHLFGYDNYKLSRSASAALVLLLKNVTVLGVGQGWGCGHRRTYTTFGVSQSDVTATIVVSNAINLLN